MARDRSFIIPDANAWCRDMPASSAVRCGDLLFIAGQVSADAKLRPLARGDIRRQARNAFARIAEILAAEGGSMDDVLDVMAFVKDPRDMDAVLAVGSEHFPDDGPAWTLAGMTGSYRPELLVSIRAIAHLGPGRRSCVTPPRSCRRGSSTLWFSDGTPCSQRLGARRPTRSRRANSSARTGFSSGAGAALRYRSRERPWTSTRSRWNWM